MSCQQKAYHEALPFFLAAEERNHSSQGFHFVSFSLGERLSEVLTMCLLTHLDHHNVTAAVGQNTLNGAKSSKSIKRQRRWDGKVFVLIITW